MKAALQDVLTRLPGPRTQDWPQGEPFAEALQHGSMLLEVFAPRGRDTQTPHSQDEIYIIVSGSAVLDVEGRKTQAATGDALLVAAYAEHHFHDISEDFITWVVLWGPDGGEKP